MRRITYTLAAVLLVVLITGVSASAQGLSFGINVGGYGGPSLFIGSSPYYSPYGYYPYGYGAPSVYTTPYPYGYGYNNPYTYGYHGYYRGYNRGYYTPGYMGQGPYGYGGNGGHGGYRY